MNRRKLLKIGLGTGLVAAVAAASLAVASPTLAQGITAMTRQPRQPSSRSVAAARAGLWAAWVAAACSSAPSPRRSA